MNILIPHSWLSEFIKTSATPQEIAEALSASGPTVERITKSGNDYVYEIETTTNRVDMMSIYGIAREAAVILPRFGYKTKLIHSRLDPIKSKSDLGITITNDPKLCKRILAVKLENVQLGESPGWLKDRLLKVEQRPLNNAIDITNYVMWELGHPIHAFDYDKINTKKIVVRSAKKGERLITLDDNKYKLNGGEVVFDDGTGKIIDLPGIMGTKNTVVSKDTKNVLLWIESVDPLKIRQASMGLNIRSQAAILNEKQVDPELGYPAILRTVELYKKITGCNTASKLVDIYPAPYTNKKVESDSSFINSQLGVELPKKEISNMLKDLGFEPNWRGNKLVTSVPSYRSHDINIKEDIVEEIARIYGYHNLKSELMQGELPKPDNNSLFEFENSVKQIIKGLGGVEVYTSSLVPKEFAATGALKLKNPLGVDKQYMRTSLMPSLIQAAAKNSGEKDPFHLFELANIYIATKSNLPSEQMILAGIIENEDYRVAKGIVEQLLNELNIEVNFVQKDSKMFIPNHRVSIQAKSKEIGQMGLNSKDSFYYEFNINALAQYSLQRSAYQPLAKYPAQIEDITLGIPERVKIGDVLSSIGNASVLINKVELRDVYKDNYTFRIWYQNPKKTLTDKEVKTVREGILSDVKRKFGATFQS